MAGRANPNLIQRTLIVAGLAVAVIVGMAVYQIDHAYRFTVETQRRAIQQLTQIFEASTDTMFQSVELIVDHAAEEVIDHLALPGLYPYLTDRFIGVADQWSFVHSVAYVGLDGQLTNVVARADDGTLQARVMNVDLSNREGITFHSKTQGADKRALYISEPVSGITSPDLVVYLTKAVYDRQGVYHGVSLVAISLATFSDLFSDLLPAAYKSVAAFKRDGTLLFRLPSGSEPGASLTDAHLFSEWLTGLPDGTSRASGVEEQSERLVSFRVSQRYPIVITVSAEWDEILAKWRSDSLILIGSGLIGVFMILGLTWWLVQRMKAEQEALHSLTKSEHSLAESQRLSGIGHFERDLTTGVMRWASNMFAVHGVTPSVFTPSREAFLSLVLPEDRAIVKERWGPEDNPFPRGYFECRIGLPSGEIRYMRYNWQVLDDGDLEQRRVFGVAQDMTALRWAEDTIRDDEARLRDIIECSSDYIWESDADGFVTFFAGKGVEQFGNVVKLRRSIFRNPSHFVADEAAVHDALVNKRKFRNMVVSSKDGAGETHWLRISGNPRYDKKGEFSGYRGAATDVTEIKLQAETAEHRRKIEALGRLAGGLAHEINNLLQPVVIYATVGGSVQGLSEDVRRYFGRIARAAEHATLIVKNVLAFARQSPPKRDSFNIASVVTETVELVEGLLDPGVSLVVAQDLVDAPVWGDRTGLAQAIRNLITNAVEALPDGGRIELQAQEVEILVEAAKALGVAPGRYCRLDVEDNGSGISSAQVSKVFDPFFTTKAQGKGTGLGLSVVLGLAKSWGGTATVDSMIGVGSRFSIYIPIAEQHLQAAQ